ncbi:unnamed protein product, partial [Rotaria socialis]
GADAADRTCSTWHKIGDNGKTLSDQWLAPTGDKPMGHREYQLVTGIMANNEYISDNLQVGMNDSGISSGIIFTEGLGPCMFFLLHNTRQTQPLCYLEHYSFLSKDESMWSTQRTLIFLLNKISQKLKTVLGIFSLAPDRFGLGDFQLLVGAGDINEAHVIDSAIALINENKQETIRALSKHKDALFLYKQLVNQVIVLKPVTRNLTNAEEGYSKFF